MSATINNSGNPNLPATLNYWVGAGTTNVLGTGSNYVLFANPDTTAESYSISTLPANTTAAFTPVSSTNTGWVALNFFSTNLSAGSYYPLTLTGNNAGSGPTTANINLFVVPQWAVTNNTANWSANSSWNGGNTPSSTSSVYIENQTGGFTNIVDTSTTIQDLTILGDIDANLAIAKVCALQIPAGNTLSVKGTNGMFVGVKTSNSTRPYYEISGAGALVVSNPVANFTIASGASGSSTRILQFNMTNLNTFVATVNRVGLGDATLNNSGLIGGSSVGCGLAKTNTIVATYSDNYTGLAFQNGIQFSANGDFGSGAIVPFCNLGITNGIYAESLGVGRSGFQSSSSVGINGGCDTLRFLPIWTNETAPTATAYFANTNGGRMKLVAVGVDSGIANGNKNTKGTIDLRGGKINLYADQIWLGSNRSNETANVLDQGALLFDWGTVNANTVNVGFMQYTNQAFVDGYLRVGTNGTMYINSALNLGSVPGGSGINAIWSAVSGCGSVVQIDNGGTLCANTINVGLYSTNAIVLNGGTLILTNTLGSSAAALSSLNIQSGSLTLSVTGASTNCYVTNLTTTTTQPVINFASLPPGQSTNVILVYQAANSVPAFKVGTLPAGYNNVSFAYTGGTGGGTVSVIVSTNSPKNLVWRGSASAIWNHSDYNWWDTSANVVTHFTDGDRVIFDDSGIAATNITIGDNVNPNQSGTGIIFTNYHVGYIFNGANNGIYSIGSCVLAQSGTNNLEIDATTGANIQLNGGQLYVSSTGTIGSGTIASGTTFTNAGAITGGVSCNGTFQNVGVIAGSLTLGSGAVVNNYGGGEVQGSLSLGTGATLNNWGQFDAIGNTTVPTNSVLYNAGTIYGATSASAISGSSLTVSVGGTLIDVDNNAGNLGGDAYGSINVGTLTIAGNYQPGGNGLGNSAITDFSEGGNEGTGAGRLQLNAGSKTTLYVNSTNSQPQTGVYTYSIVYGPSQVARAKNGCTLIISNVGPSSLTAGQTFKFFNEFAFPSGAPNNAGLNTTNTYPVIIPATPGAGLVWDLSQLYASGTIGVISAASQQMMLTNSTALIGTNIVVNLSWPSSFAGVGWVQQQINPTSIGLSTNWTDIGASDYVNSLSLTNVVNGNNAVFYRFQIP